MQQLEPRTAARAVALVNAVRAAGYPLVITSSRRTPAEQRELVRLGRSETLRSAHLEGRGFDVDVAGVARDDVPLWFWQAVGPYAERWLGLTWGGRWASLRDYGHFEMR